MCPDCTQRGYECLPCYQFRRWWEAEEIKRLDKETSK